MRRAAFRAAQFVSAYTDRVQRLVTAMAMVASVALAACYRPAFPEGLACSETERCPEGQMCGVDGFCRSTAVGQPGDGGAGLDGASGDGGGGGAIGEEIRITQTQAMARDPDLAWNGSAIGLAWGDKRQGAEQIYFTRLGPTGGLIAGAQPITTDTVSRGPFVAATADSFGLTWYQTLTDTTVVYFIELGSSGAPLAAAVPVSDLSISLALSRAIVSDGSDYLVSWWQLYAQERQVYLGGTAISDAVQVTLSGSTASLGWGASEAGVVWIDVADASNNDLMFASYRMDGTEVTAPVAVLPPAKDLTWPVIAWAQNAYGVAWIDRDQDPHALMFALVDDTGAVQSQTTIPDAAGDRAFPVIAWNGSHFGIAWQELTPTGSEIYFVRASDEGVVVGEPLAISASGATAAHPAMTWTGQHFVIAWDDDRHGEPQIYLYVVPPL